MSTSQEVGKLEVLAFNKVNIFENNICYKEPLPIYPEAEQDIERLNYDRTHPVLKRYISFYPPANTSVFIDGTSGIGKTSAIRRTAFDADVAGIRCYDNDYAYYRERYPMFKDKGKFPFLASSYSCMLTKRQLTCEGLWDRHYLSNILYDILWSLPEPGSMPEKFVQAKTYKALEYALYPHQEDVHPKSVIVVTGEAELLHQRCRMRENGIDESLPISYIHRQNWMFEMFADIMGFDYYHLTVEEMNSDFLQKVIKDRVILINGMVNESKHPFFHSLPKSYMKYYVCSNFQRVRIPSLPRYSK